LENRRCSQLSLLEDDSVGKFWFAMVAGAIFGVLGFLFPPLWAEEKLKEWFGA